MISISSHLSVLASELQSLPQLFGQMKGAIKRKDLNEIESLFEKIVKKSGVVMPKWEPSKKDLELQAAFLPILKALGRHDEDIEELVSEGINWGGKLDLYIGVEKGTSPGILEKLETLAKLLDFSIIAPSEGGSFDPRVHSAYSEENSAVPKAKVIRCNTYGYKDASGQVRRKAKVVLSRGK